MADGNLRQGTVKAQGHERVLYLYKLNTSKWPERKKYWAVMGETVSMEGERLFKCLVPPLRAWILSCYTVEG